MTTDFQDTEKEPLIAVVDDDLPVRKALQRLLRSAGFLVQTYPSGEDFLRTLHVVQPDCLVLDLHLPGLSGLEVLHQLISVGAGFPTILMTGSNSSGLAGTSTAAGAVAFLVKPLEEAELLSAVQQAMA